MGQIEVKLANPVKPATLMNALTKAIEELGLSVESRDIFGPEHVLGRSGLELEYPYSSTWCSVLSPEKELVCIVSYDKYATSLDSFGVHGYNDRVVIGRVVFSKQTPMGSFFEVVSKYL